MIAAPERDELLALKRITLTRRRMQLRIPVHLPEQQFQGHCNITGILVSDSYLDCEYRHTLPIQLLPPPPTVETDEGAEDAAVAVKEESMDDGGTVGISQKDYEQTEKLLLGKGNRNLGRDVKGKSLDLLDSGDVDV